jgi:transposase
MQDTELYSKVLGVAKPWRVTQVEVNEFSKTVTVHVIHDQREAVTCPICGQTCGIHDHRIRRFRHLDTCDFQTVIECQVPRSSCSTDGVKQLSVPWAEDTSRFSALFEASVILWQKAAVISAVAGRMGISWDQAAAIQARAVDRGLARRKQTPLHEIAIDETSFQKRHEYVTVIVDRAKDVVVDVLNDRKAETLSVWFASQKPSLLRGIRTITMDMWDPFIKAVRDTIPDAESKICFDRFHVAMYFGKALDKVRAMEHRVLQKSGIMSALKGTRHEWLRTSRLTDNRSRRAFLSLTRTNLKTARAWAIKETASSLWDYVYLGAAKRAWMMLLQWIAKCRLEPVMKVGRMVRRYLWGILNAIIAKTTNAMAEAKNARIQRIKSMACGFRNRDRFRKAILFHLGGLDLMPSACSSAT